VPGTGSTRTVLVTAKAHLDDWIAIKARYNVRSATMLPDYLCLPWTSGTLTISATEPNRLLVRTGETTGFAGERQMVLQMLDLMRTRHSPEIEMIALLPETAQADAGLMAELSKWGMPVQHSKGACNLPHASLLAGTGQGAELGPRARAYSWLLAASLAAVAFWAVNTEIEIRQTNNATALQRQSNTAFVRDKLHVTGPIVDLRVQVDRVLSTLRQAAQDDVPQMRFPDLLRKAGPILADPAIKVTELRYQDAALVLAVQIQDFAALETLRKELQSPGISAEILRSIGDGTAGVRAEIRLVQSRKGG
jgi:type II secretory pathway component PulL